MESFRDKFITEMPNMSLKEIVPIFRSQIRQPQYLPDAVVVNF